MENSINSAQSEQENIIRMAKAYGDTYEDLNEAKIAAKGFASGYIDAVKEKNLEIKELAGIVKLFLPAIQYLPQENLKLIEEYLEDTDLFGNKA